MGNPRQHEVAHKKCHRQLKDFRRHVRQKKKLINLTMLLMTLVPFFTGHCGERSSNIFAQLSNWGFTVIKLRCVSGGRRTKRLFCFSPSCIVKVSFEKKTIFSW